MARVYHGRMDLGWCDTCRSPLIQGRTCPSCGEMIKKVSYTPPGDIRPAFVHDIKEVMTIVDKQWGQGAGEYLVRDVGPIILNPCPGPDRLEEVIMDGSVVGSIQFSNKKMTSSLIIREAGGRRLAHLGFSPEKGFVIIDPSVLPFLLDGKNLLSPGIVGAHQGIEPGDEVLVMDEQERIVGSGNARKIGSEMVGTKGMGVKIRWAIEPVEEIETSDPGSVTNMLDEDTWRATWSHVIEVNSELLESKVGRSKGFIKSLQKNSERPVAVSYSGGKDSLATLYLALETGLRPPVIFIDTGLEFPETLKHVHSLIDELGLELYEEKPISGFFENLEKFGPPGRDYRWCCKLCKLGPTSRLIDEKFPDGVIALIGQRRFESDQREKKGSVWENPWVPKQKGASPVQNWTALDIWLYIFSRNAPYNPLYAQGYQRIGCWLCPSCDLAELELVSETLVDTSEWGAFLEKERKEAGLPPEWISMGYHRFKNAPPHMIRLAKETGLDAEVLTRRRSRRSESSILEMVEGTNSCVDGISREGLIGKDVPWDKFVELLNILGRVEVDPHTKGIMVEPNNWNMKRKAVEAFPDGTLVIRAPDEKMLKRRNLELLSVIKRAVGCIGCSICVGRCPTGALKVVRKTRSIELNPEKCQHCSACLGPCPAEAFVDDPFEI